MPVPFDSQKIYYRTPFGAVEEGTTIHLRILLPRDLHTQRADLAVKYDYDYNWEYFGFFWCGTFDDATEIWEADFTPNKIGLALNFKQNTVSDILYRLIRIISAP